jgi:hypothetical protein
MYKYTRKVGVHVDGVPDNLAVFKRGCLSAEVLELPDGRKYPLQYVTDEKNQDPPLYGYRFRTEAGEEFISYEDTDYCDVVNIVNIHPAAANIPETPWIVMLGLYDFMLRQVEGHIV